MSALSGARVLIVEDEPVVAMCLEDMLEGFGCVTIGPAGRVAEGLALVAGSQIDAAILDINLGGERSTQIAEALRLRGVPFVFASGYAAPPEGFAETTPLVSKPYRETEIAAALAAILSRG